MFEFFKKSISDAKETVSGFFNNIVADFYTEKMAEEILLMIKDLAGYHECEVINEKDAILVDLQYCLKHCINDERYQNLDVKEQKMIKSAIADQFFEISKNEETCGNEIDSATNWFYRIGHGFILHEGAVHFPEIFFKNVKWHRDEKDRIEPDNFLIKNVKEGLQKAKLTVFHERKINVFVETDFAKNLPKEVTDKIIDWTYKPFKVL